ncbi:MAG TPA: GntR family transcriptional regulator [Tepidisphaeraceae bacterium]|nr:GntR family transcriptional regulator [Tepidisphaeraceae bacterium]
MDFARKVADEGNPSDQDASRLSYKFQRLRERLREAVASGELSGKLPGERQLAKRFHVNAKTLSKALTDLAAEGLLQRSIGRGTFVKGSNDLSTSSNDRWLLLCDEDQTSSAILEHIRRMHPAVHVAHDTSSLRPSFLNSVKAVIDMSSHTPETFLRDLIVRNLTVVLVGREPSTYSVNAVLVDRALGGACLARDMMLAGHRKFLAVERRGHTAVAEAIRRAARRYATDAVVDGVFPADVAVGVEQHGATAIICDTRRMAVEVRNVLKQHNIPTPQRVSLAAIGSGWGDYPCSGHFISSQQKAQAVVHLIGETNLKRPTTIWMTGAFVDRGTIGAPHGMPVHTMQQPQIAQVMSYIPAPQRDVI